LHAGALTRRDGVTGAQNDFRRAYGETIETQTGKAGLAAQLQFDDALRGGDFSARCLSLRACDWAIAAKSDEKRNWLGLRLCKLGRRLR
jgi:hypothetical protein